MKYLILVFMACTLVCTAYAAAIENAAVQQDDDEGDDGKQSLLSFLEAEMQEEDEGDDRVKAQFHIHLYKKAVAQARSLLKQLKAAAQDEDEGAKLQHHSLLDQLKGAAQDEGDDGAKAQFHLHLYKKALVQLRYLLKQLKAAAQDEDEGAKLQHHFLLDQLKGAARDEGDDGAKAQFHLHLYKKALAQVRSLLKDLKAAAQDDEGEEGDN